MCSTLLRQTRHSRIQIFNTNRIQAVVTEAECDVFISSVLFLLRLLQNYTKPRNLMGEGFCKKVAHEQKLYPFNDIRLIKIVTFIKLYIG